MTTAGNRISRPAICYYLLYITDENLNANIFLLGGLWWLKAYIEYPFILFKKEVRGKLRRLCFAELIASTLSLYNRVVQFKCENVLLLI